MSAPADITVHLYGGPLDGARQYVPASCHALRCEGYPGDYVYCPHASARISAQRGKDAVVFIHSTIEHDSFHPSLAPG